MEKILLNLTATFGLAAEEGSEIWEFMKRQKPFHGGTVVEKEVTIQPATHDDNISYKTLNLLVRLCRRYAREQGTKVKNAWVSLVGSPAIFKCLLMNGEEIKFYLAPASEDNCKEVE